MINGVGDEHAKIQYIQHSAQLTAVECPGVIMYYLHPDIQWKERKRKEEYVKEGKRR